MGFSMPYKYFYIVSDYNQLHSHLISEYKYLFGQKFYVMLCHKFIMAEIKLKKKQNNVI